MESSLKRRRVKGYSPGTPFWDGYFLRRKYDILANLPIDVFARVILVFSPDELTDICLTSKTIYTKICQERFKMPYMTKWMHELALGLLDSIENHRQEYIQRWLNSVKNSILDKEDLLAHVTQYGGVKTFKKILSLGVDITSGENIALINAVNANHLTMVKILLKRGADPSVDDNYCLELASANGNEKMVKLLLSLPTTNPGPSTIRDAVRSGCIAVVKLLLEDGRVNPGANDNSAINVACWLGHSSILKLLLKDPRTDPSDGNNVILLTAVERGYYRIVRRLLMDPRVDPSDNHNPAIIAAANHGNAPILELLLKDGRADPKIMNSAPLSFAAILGHYKIVKILLKDGRADPSVNNNRAIRDAAWGGHTGIVYLLLADKRVDPTAEDNYVLKIAISRRYHLMVKTLLRDDRIDLNVALNHAACKGRLYIVKMIVKINIWRKNPVKLNVTKQTRLKVRSQNYRRKFMKIYRIIRDLF
jgi:ankyrin repeat protein